MLFGSTGVKDTLRNVRATGEFVVNVATLGEVFRLERPSWADVADADAADRIRRREA